MSLSQLFSPVDLTNITAGKGAAETVPVDGMASYHIVNQSGAVFVLISDTGQIIDSIPPFFDVIGFFPDATRTMQANCSPVSPVSKPPDFPPAVWSVLYEVADPSVQVTAGRTSLRPGLSATGIRPSNLLGSVTYTGPKVTAKLATLVLDIGVVGVAISFQNPPPLSTEVQLYLVDTATQYILSQVVFAARAGVPVVIPLPQLLSQSVDLIVSDTRTGNRTLYATETFDTISVFPNNNGNEALTVAGVVTANQGGTWTVAVSGTTTVAGTVTANQGGAWSVGQSGNWNVGINSQVWPFTTTAHVTIDAQPIQVEYTGGSTADLPIKVNSVTGNVPIFDAGFLPTAGYYASQTGTGTVPLGAGFSNSTTRMLYGGQFTVSQTHPSTDTSGAQFQYRLQLKGQTSGKLLELGAINIGIIPSVTENFGFSVPIVLAAPLNLGAYFNTGETIIPQYVESAGLGTGSANTVSVSLIYA